MTSYSSPSASARARAGAMRRRGWAQGRQGTREGGRHRDDVPRAAARRTVSASRPAGGRRARRPRNTAPLGVQLFVQTVRIRPTSQHCKFLTSRPDTHAPPPFRALNSLSIESTNSPVISMAPTEKRNKAGNGSMGREPTSSRSRTCRWGTRRTRAREGSGRGRIRLLGGARPVLARG